MNKFITILIGLIFLSAPIYAWIIGYGGFGIAALEFLKGGLVWLSILIGVLTLTVGLSTLRE